MLLPVFRDLLKPQWRKLIEQLKLSGGMPVSDLARLTGASYMAVKNQCEELKELGYLIRTRLPRTAVGRPEIFYSLGEKSDALFPQAGVAFSLELLEETRLMFGDSAPDKLLFQYFQNLHDSWSKPLQKLATPAERAAKLATLRAKLGCAVRHEAATDDAPECIIEFHNPLQPVLALYPRAEAMEQRMLETLLGCRLTRTEHPTGRQSPPIVVFEIL